MNHCGTMRGYRKHIRIKESTCQPCKDACREYKRLVRSSNPEKTKAENRASYLKHSDKVNERNRAFRKANPDKVKEYQSNYRNSHKTERDTYRRNNLDKFRGYARKRLAWKYGSGSSKYTEKQVIELYGTDCHICLKAIDFEASRKVGIKNWEQGLHIDHVIPLVKGGLDTLENVRPAHAKCNLAKGKKC